MKMYLDCYACAVRQTLQALRESGVDESRHVEILNRVLRELISLDPSLTPPEFGAKIHSLIREEVGCEDPYKKIKRKSTAEALKLYPKLKKRIQDSSDPIDTATRLCIAGNIIDLGAASKYNLGETIERVLSQPYATSDFPEFKRKLHEAEKILMLADNAGETVFDRLFIETVAKSVTYAVKDGPCINDATIEDARQAGLDEVAEVISCGAQAPATVLKWCSPDFLSVYNQADLVIAKGMGNYEALSQENHHLYFLLQVKCEMVSRDIGAPVGSIVVKPSAPA